jgi:hypothetical protein
VLTRDDPFVSGFVCCAWIDTYSRSLARTPVDAAAPTQAEIMAASKPLAPSASDFDLSDWLARVHLKLTVQARRSMTDRCCHFLLMRSRRSHLLLFSLHTQSPPHRRSRASCALTGTMMRSCWRTSTKNHARPWAFRPRMANILSRPPNSWLSRALCHPNPKPSLRRYARAAAPDCLRLDV